MDYLRGSVNLRAYGQRDPLVEYKKESTLLFKNLIVSINAHVISVIPSLGATVDVHEAKARAEMEDAARIISSTGSTQRVSGEEKKGRNEKVVVVKNGEEKEVKWKKLSDYLADGWTQK
jgi:preprotein translocase subunit SecA